MGQDNQTLDMHLIQSARQGEVVQKEELIRKYMPMVRHVVSRHYASFLDFDDLVQEGLIGLLHAIDEYRPEKFDVKFSSFAYLCIVRKIYNVIKHTNGNKHKLLNDAISLYAFTNDEETRTLLDRVADERDHMDPSDLVTAKATNEILAGVLKSHLSTLEFEVITLYLQGYSTREIEGEIGVTAKVVDNARTRVRLKLRRLLEQYGSLVSSQIPGEVRRRKDLYMQLQLNGA